MKFDTIDCCPVPHGLARRLEKVANKRHDFTLTSCYRGTHPSGVAILHKCGKRSQQELYDCYQRREPGCNPANRPGTSTHELKSDGVVYRGPAGRDLKGWQCGMDISTAQVEQFIRDCDSFAWDAFRPYASGSEAHHVNFRRKPPWRWGRKRPEHHTIKRGTWRHREVRRAQRSLNTRDAYDLKVDGDFGDETERAVKKFQRRHHLVDDGVIGQRTWDKLLKGDA